MLIRLVAVVLALLAPAAQAQETASRDRPGDAWELRLQVESETSGDGSSSRSSSRSGLIERVIAVSEAGVELEYDLPAGTTAEDRARQWSFPARVLRSPEGEMRLLNAPELEARVAAWLAAGEMTREACGRWIFTWTALRIECDPQTVILALERYDLRSDRPRHGTMAVSAEGASLLSQVPVDPELIRRERAEMDVVVAEITGSEPLAFEAALQARAGERISGTTTTVVETDPANRVVRRIRVVNLEITAADGSVERGTTTETVERRRVGPVG
jgi:hypothetical protein